jgi:hypothetical protein
MDPIPTTKQELERKTLEALVEIGERFKAKLISAPDARARVHAIWQVTAGLIDRELDAQVQALDAELLGQGGATLPETLHLRKPDGTLVRIVYPLAAPGLLVTRYRVDVLEPQTLYRSETTEGADRRRVLKTLLTDMAGNGYQII